MSATSPLLEDRRAPAAPPPFLPPEGTVPARRRLAGGTLALSVVTVVSVFYMGWELLDQRFLAGWGPSRVHLLYVSRGVLTALLSAAWAAWFVRRDRLRHEEEARRLQVRLFQAEKLSALGELASGLTHEINNPIAIMSSRLELMIQDAQVRGEPPQVLKDLEVLRRQAVRVAEITRSLLHFARTSPAEKTGPVDLSAAADSVLRLLEEIAHKRGIRLQKNLGRHLPPVEGHQGQLEQVMLNLVKNAMEAVEGVDAPEIRVATWYGLEDRTVRFLVADNGPGLPPSAESRVFDPFFTTKERGTGLGLSVSYGIVSRHGGKLTIPGKGPEDPSGTCFMVTLPRAGGDPS
jgi:C4-dicarboxylate-specific signal transduction histidine kinase